MPSPLILNDSSGRRWTILHTAEQSYLQVMRRLHPSITSEHAREEWRELVDLVRYLRPARDPRLEVWRAAGAFDRVYLVVERTTGSLRVCEVRPAHGASARPAPSASPAAASPTGISSPTTSSSTRRAPLPTPNRPRPARTALPLATPPPERPVPVVDPGILLLVGAELAGGAYHSASSIAERRQLPVREVRDAVLDRYAPEAPPRHRPEVASVEVMTARRRPPR